MNYQQAVAAYKSDPSKENLNRSVEDLCAEMTLREKTKLLHGNTIGFYSHILYSAVFHGSMFFLPFSGGGCRRLGIPRLAFSDGPKGAVTGHGTCFPSPIMRGCSFDPELEYRVGTAMAREAKAANANLFAGICLNLIRNPRGGRSQDSFGEDPFLIGQMGSRLVMAVQDEGLIACPKHLALNSIENLRFLESSNCDERTLREIYLHHFKKCVNAGALSIMAAYNKVNRVYCCENKLLLTDILRQEWGFEGFTMSDFIWGIHATATALKAGLDLEMPTAQYFNYHRIKKSISHAELSVEDVDRAVRHILSVMIRLSPGKKPPSKEIMKSKQHLELAEEAAVKGMVLLKNENSLLPLPGTAKIAVVGPFADTINLGDRGSNLVVTKDAVTPYAGISRQVPNVKCYNGLDCQKALKSAAQADTVIACIGCDSKDEGEFLINPGDKMKKKPKYIPGGDRESLALNPSHLHLLEALKKAGKHVIAVLYTGSVILTEELEPYTDAIIMGYYGGIGFGNSLAALLLGEKNFSGKLTVSIAKRAGDYPPFLEIGQRPYEIDFGYYNGYYLFDKNGTQSSYPFGFGLSYTHFDISAIQTIRNSQGGITVQATIKNIGDRSGAEVVQVYVGSTGAAHSGSTLPERGRPGTEGLDQHRPVKLLRGFKRIELAPAESQNIAIDIALEDLRFYNMQKKAWVLDPVYKIFVGTSSANAAPVANVPI